MSSEQELSNINNLYSSEGKDKQNWILFLNDINNDSLNDKILSFLQKNLKENPKNELTVDIIDFIIDFGNQKIINLIAQKQFLDLFIDLLKSETNAGVENQKKVIYLTQKWAKKFNENQNLPIFMDNYNFLKGNGIAFPPENYVMHTYDKFINKNDIENERNKQQISNEQNNNNNFQQNNDEFSLFNQNNNILIYKFLLLIFFLK